MGFTDKPLVANGLNANPFQSGSIIKHDAESTKRKRGAVFSPKHASKRHNLGHGSEFDGNSDTLVGETDSGIMGMESTPLSLSNAPPMPTLHMDAAMNDSQSRRKETN